MPPFSPIYVFSNHFFQSLSNMDEEKFTVKEEVLDLEDLFLPPTSQKPNCNDLNTNSETFVKSETDNKPENIFGISGKNQNKVSIETENLTTTEKEDSVEYELPYGWKKVGIQRKDKGGLISGKLLILVQSSIWLPIYSNDCSSTCSFEFSAI